MTKITNREKGKESCTHQKDKCNFLNIQQLFSNQFIQSFFNFIKTLFKNHKKEIIDRCLDYFLYSHYCCFRELLVDSLA